MSTELGVVYVFELSNGRVKVGRTKSIGRRLKDHDRIARLYADEGIVKKWHSIEHYNFPENERFLIGFLGGDGCSEWTDDVDFGDVVKYAESLTYKTKLTQEEIDEEDRKFDGVKHALTGAILSDFERNLLKEFKNDMTAVSEWRKSYIRATQLIDLFPPGFAKAMLGGSHIDDETLKFIFSYVDFKGDDVFEGIPLTVKSEYDDIIINSHRQKMLHLSKLINNNDIEGISTYIGSTLEDFVEIGRQEKKVTPTQF